MRVSALSSATSTNALCEAAVSPETSGPRRLTDLRVILSPQAGLHRDARRAIGDDRLSDLEQGQVC